MIVVRLATRRCAILISMPPKALHTRWSDVPAEPMNPLLTRQFVSGSKAMVSRIELKRGCIVPRHAHPSEQIAMVIEGALRFFLGDGDAAEEKTVRAGEILVIPGDLSHAAEALEDTVNFDIFAPPREDWINGDDSYLR
jgi:quercetin dioxygenase-like cupin family protein